MRLVFFLLWAVSIAAKPLQMEVKARSAMLMNADTGAILYEKQGYASLYPASTTKIATALFVLEEKQTSLEQTLTVSAESLRMKPVNKPGNFPPYWWDSDGTRMWLCVGEKLSLDALLHGLMVVSGNDAANVIAEGVSGSVPTFIEEMNQYLKKIGCENTQFLNPHGCHHPEHYTSAYDLCLMTRKALAIPKFRQLVSTLSYKKPKTNKQGPSVLKQANKLLDPGGRFHYPKAIGVKTGFHSAAQNTLVAAATHEGRTLIAVIAAAAHRDDRYQDAIRLFEKAFEETLENRFFFGRQHLFSTEIPGAKTMLQANLSEDLSLSYYPAEEPVCRAFVHWRSFALPIRKGEVVGEVRVIDQKGNILKSGDLLAKEEVKGTLFFVLKDTFNRLFR